jgi:hypothetical protein
VITFALSVALMFGVVYAAGRWAQLKQHRMEEDDARDHRQRA